MRSSETVLGMLQDRGKQGLPVNDLYRQLYNPHLSLRAYARLYSNDGAMTKGTTEETADGMSLDKIKKVIDLIKQERFRWTPVRRTHIPKKNGEMRPLELPTWTDKLVQEVIRSLLEAYYEPQFSDASHGFRPEHGCHTALSQVRHVWTGTHWFLEGDIRQCFDKLDHTVMLSILAEKIHDGRFLRLVKHLLQAGYLEDWQYHTTYSGSPQGGVVSPILANIYLDKLDHYIEQELIPTYTRGTVRRKNPAYNRIHNHVRYWKKKGEYAKEKRFRRQLRSLPTGDPNDPNYRRLRYVRYADDTLLGFAGPKSEAEAIKRQLGEYLRDTLGLELSEEKTLITHAATQSARFLGYEIGMSLREDLMSRRGRRDVNGRIRLRMPLAVVEEKRAHYQQKGKPLRRMSLASQKDYIILNTYQAELRGLYQYYQLADNVSWLHRLQWDMQRSLLSTLAAKYRRSKQTMLRRYRATIETPHGVRCCLQAIWQRGSEKKPLVGTFGGIALKENKEAVIVDQIPTPIRYEQKEVIRRLLAGKCELCEVREEGCVVHQVRKLADLEHMGKGRPLWAHVMLKRRRKTLIVCQACHYAIHQK